MNLREFYLCAHGVFGMMMRHEIDSFSGHVETTNQIGFGWYFEILSMKHDRQYCQEFIVSHR